MNELAENMHILLKISASGKRKKSAYGIITLQSDGEGHFWFRSVGNFTSAVNESLASLELLADQVSQEMEGSQWGLVNKAYRRGRQFYFSLSTSSTNAGSRCSMRMSWGPAGRM